MEAGVARPPSFLPDRAGASCPKDALPPAVAETVRFCEAYGIWFRLAQNPPVRSCREAAARRERLGRRGIPLRDELRSYLAVGTDAEGGRRSILFHCRGDQSLSFDSVSALSLGLSNVAKANVSELGDEALGYGLINPFLSRERVSALGLVRQVFDRSLIDTAGEADTMMTNAGSLTWAIEFQPAKLVKVLGDDLALVAPIAEGEATRPLASRTIGILTGNGPESGALLWSRINAEVRRRAGSAFVGDISYPRVLVDSLPAMGWSMELEERSDLLWGRVAEELQRLVASGADVIALACNTTQYYQERIEDLLAPQGVRFIRLAESVRAFINQPRSTYVLGIGEVVSASSWSAFPFLANDPRVVLPDGARAAEIEELAYRVKFIGSDTVGLQKLRRLMRQAPCNDVLLLLTELSILYDRYGGRAATGRNVTDSMSLYAKDIVQAIWDR